MPANGQQHSSSSSFMDKLRSLDNHTAVADEFRVRTKNGAMISLFTIVSILYLTYQEYQFNVTTVEVLDRVHVNATTPAGLPVEFEIDFPYLPCALISVDAIDPTGQLQSLHLDRTHHVYKSRTKDGKVLQGMKQGMKQELGGTADEEGLMSRLNVLMEEAEVYKDCGSCYGAEDPDEDVCCNTCDDVKRAYKHKGWNLDTNNVRQCQDEAKAEDEADEGCIIKGDIALSTGGGNFHFAPSHNLEFFGDDTRDVFQLAHDLFEEYDVSHTINKLHFGEEDQFFPSQVHQLNGADRHVEDGYGMYQYYIQLIPTRYIYLNGTSQQTFQYSVTEHLRHVSPGMGRGVPGVFFFYEVSALHVEFEEARKGWIRFFTSVCAVVGGVFSVAGVLDRMLWNYERRKQRGSGGALG